MGGVWQREGGGTGVCTRRRAQSTGGRILLAHGGCAHSPVVHLQERSLVSALLS